LLLLDVNVLLALAWPNHQFHKAAVKRMERSGEKWATCAITELGFVRISSNPVMCNPPKSPREAAGLLTLMVADAHHVFLDALSPVSDLNSWPKIVGYRQVTDAYLIHVAHSAMAKLLTFDIRLAHLGPKGAVEVIHV
jgi:toxin-antitoxin system PIN domain toxin